MTNKMVLGAVSALLMAAAASPAVATPVISGADVISSADPAQKDRLFRDGTASIWSAQKAFPGTIAQSPTYYDLVNATFAANAEQTIYYEISYSTTQTSNLPFSAAYQDAFDPSDLATNYLGDSGTSPLAGTVTYDVVVAAGHQLLLNFQDVYGVPTSFSYSVSAFSDAARDENFATLTAAVPEASTWAMMLVGVGLVGGALRRRSDARFDARVKRIAAGLAA